MFERKCVPQFQTNVGAQHTQAMGDACYGDAGGSVWKFFEQRFTTQVVETFPNHFTRSDDDKPDNRMHKVAVLTGVVSRWATVLRQSGSSPAVGQSSGSPSVLRQYVSSPAVRQSVSSPAVRQFSGSTAVRQFSGSPSVLRLGSLPARPLPPQVRGVLRCVPA